MKTLRITLLLLMVLPFISCSSDSDDNSSDNPQPTFGFVWRENSATAEDNIAGSSEVRSQFNSIFAFIGPTGVSGTAFEINLTSLAPGTYTVGAANSFYFYGNTGTPSSGTVTITSNSDGKASGSFEAFYPSGTITSVYGTFTDITVN